MSKKQTSQSLDKALQNGGYTTSTVNKGVYANQNGDKFFTNGNSYREQNNTKIYQHTSGKKF